MMMTLESMAFLTIVTGILAEYRYDSMIIMDCWTMSSILRYQVGFYFETLRKTTR
jgi:hypothetical protein